MLQHDLFAVPLLPGLSYVENLVTPDEEAELTARIDAEGLSPFRFQGWEGKRLTASFGWHYDFDDRRFAETTPMPDWLRPIRDRAARFGRLAAPDLVQALLLRYDPGAGIGWHRDRPVFEHVVGLSLGAPAILRFRRPLPQGGFARAALDLAPRSAYLLSGEARHLWQHSITPMERTRHAITFRTLAAIR